MGNLIVLPRLRPLDGWMRLRLGFGGLINRPNTSHNSLQQKALSIGVVRLTAGDFRGFLKVGIQEKH